MRFFPLITFRWQTLTAAGVIALALLAPSLEAAPKSKKPTTSKSKAHPKPFPGGPAAMAERFHQEMSAHMQEAASARRQAQAEGRRLPLPFPPPFPFAPGEMQDRGHAPVPREDTDRPRYENPRPPVYRDDRQLRVPPDGDDYQFQPDPYTEPFPERYEEYPEGIRPAPEPAPPSRSREADRPRYTPPTPSNPPRQEPPRLEHRDLPVARPVPGQDGFVTIDGYPTPIDVRGIAPGTPVEVPDPSNPDETIQFRVP